MQPYTPTYGEQTPPPAIGYARMYSGAFTVMYVLCVLGGIGFTVLAATGAMAGVHPRGGGMSGTADAFIRGIIMIVMGIPLAIVSAMAFFGKNRTRGAWILNLVLFGLGCMSCCCIPFAAYMLVLWLKPEVKAWYGV